MENMTAAELVMLQCYASQLEEFTARVGRLCATMEDGLSGCGAFMQEQRTKQLIKDGTVAVRELKTCLHSARQVLERIDARLEEA